MEHDEGHEYELQDLAAELLRTHSDFRGRLSEPVDDPAFLTEIAADLGGVLVHLSRDDRLRYLTRGAGGSWRDRSLRSQLGQLLLIDWTGLLDRSGYQGDPSAAEFADDLLRATAAFATKPTPDSYEVLRSYLFDLGTRLLELGDEVPSTVRRRDRLARAVGRGLWVVGRVGLAALVGGLVATAIPPAGPLAGAAVYAVLGEVAKEVSKTLVEEVIPKPGEGVATATREALEFDERATILSELLRAGSLGRLGVDWQTAAQANLSGDDLRELRQHTQAWCSAVQAATLTMRSLGAALWNGLGDQVLEHLARELTDLQWAVRREETGDAVQIIDRIDSVGFEVQRLLEQQAYRNHP
ncbi:hypothetical protein ACIA49_35500 [Kribbella sp. NPDC051587]|uniref:hypothetical protein n=1 Tax=Kribbella sp. NPDC051587 TaxID=3364119 RepID=UPI0037AC8905